MVIKLTTKEKGILYKTIKILLIGVVLLGCLILMVYLLNLWYISLTENDPIYNFNQSYRSFWAMVWGTIWLLIKWALYGMIVIITFLLGYLPWHFPTGALLIYSVITLIILGKALGSGGGHH